MTEHLKVLSLVFITSYLASASFQILGMNSYSSQARKRLHDHVFIWDQNFAARQTIRYRAEDNHLVPADGQRIIDAFLEEQRSRLDPPHVSYVALRKFLESAGEVSWDKDATPSNRNVLLVLLDDRRDGTGWQDINGTQHSPRNWDGYANYPSRGEKRVSGLLNPKDLYNKLLKA